MVQMPTNRRRHVRRSHPTLETRLGGDVYTALDWSLGGLAVSGLANCLHEQSDGAEITGYFGVAGEGIGFKFSAVIARIDPAQDVVGLDFTRLWPESTEILEDLFRRPPNRRLPPAPLRPRDFLMKALDITAPDWARQSPDTAPQR